MNKIAAIIGGGVIGGGWAARFVLNGWNVNIFDPDPQAARKIDMVMENARRSYPGLLEHSIPQEGRIQFVDSIEKAVKEAAWVQESVPEVLKIKQETFARIQNACLKDAVIGSSTSGFKPSELQTGAQRPEQILVAHPFNPVYLLPLVELASTAQNNARLIEKASRILTSLGMYPLRLRKEIDAHIADRFLEAVWREALWLVKDGIATTEEIDNAIRYGFGLRWAQMGLFETYRIAGGEGGMRHFMAQFGPALKWPWTKLMDVPEFTDTLVDTIADQSDAQSGQYSIRELERIRDNNLVAMMRALKAQNWGAGALLNAVDPPANIDVDFSALIETSNRTVPLDWTDYNGHMNEARYLHAFSDATDQFLRIIGCGLDYVAQGRSYFTAETHLRHIDEVRAGTPIQVKTYCAAAEGKKLHIFHQMFAKERLLATGEHMLIHVDLNTRKASLPTPQISDIITRMAKAHTHLDRPEGIGRTVGKK